MSEEAQVFRGDRPTEEADASIKSPAEARKKPDTILARADLPAGEPVGDTPEAAPVEPSVEPAGATGSAATELPAEPEPDYHFEVDPESLWSMPAAMQERLTNLSSAAAVVHQQLDEQEKETARIARRLRALG